MKSIILENCISKINLDKEVMEKLKENKIMKVEDLWELKRNDLKQIGLTSQEIKHIKIKMQLHSLDLNGKKYKKN